LEAKNYGIIFWTNLNYQSLALSKHINERKKPIKDFVSYTLLNNRVRVGYGLESYIFLKNSGLSNVSYVAKWIRGWTANPEVKSSNPVQVSKKKKNR